MMLFELPVVQEDNTAGDGISQQLDHKTGGKLPEVLQLVAPGSCVHWVTEGDWSMHDLLTGLLNITRPAAVMLSSYAFSEYPARILAELKARKIITKLHCLVDSRIDTRSAGALNLVRNCADQYKLVHTHAKVTVIEGKNIRVVVIGSANYTTNKRYEAGVIILDDMVVDFHKKWMQDEFIKN